MAPTSSILSGMSHKVKCHQDMGKETRRSQGLVPSIGVQGSNFPVATGEADPVVKTTDWGE